MGIHILAEFLGVDQGKISRVERTREILDRVVSRSGFRAVSSSFYQFEPYGVSAVYLLAESHLSVHTWPEYGYLALDIFSCGGEEPALRAYELLVEEFQPVTVERRIIRRNLYEKVGAKNTG